ncbi:MAG: helix-turn-helix domain-containing protein, partial [Desulfatiglandales bacterium]
EHFVLRALLFRTGEMVGIEDLAIINRGMLSHKEIALSPPYSLKEKELDLIKAALQKTGGKKKEAAKLLGIHPTTLYRKLKALGIGPYSL